MGRDRVWRSGTRSRGPGTGFWPGFYGTAIPQFKNFSKTAKYHEIVFIEEIRCPAGLRPAARGRGTRPARLVLHRISRLERAGGRALDATASSRLCAAALLHCVRMIDLERSVRRAQTLCLGAQTQTLRASKTRRVCTRTLAREHSEND